MKSIQKTLEEHLEYCSVQSYKKQIEIDALRKENERLIEKCNDMPIAKEIIATLVRVNHRLGAPLYDLSVFRGVVEELASNSIVVDIVGNDRPYPYTMAGDIVINVVRELENIIS